MQELLIHTLATKASPTVLLGAYQPNGDDISAREKPRANVNPDRKAERYDLEPATRARVAELNALDLDLYARAQARFEALRAGIG